ncbi:hypothetical protein ALC56_01738 [Trachymyrmex septentrionalis]|uniref:Uncharacterized protein n=1 Tax=Trachymyrmex septentrionalis TaxID=34720 RepID=A0A195FTS8_9HYME|nr:hypothetical protein ALC56_01738 [Trachymyrmex septentrionalis]
MHADIVPVTASIAEQLPRYSLHAQQTGTTLPPLAVPFLLSYRTNNLELKLRSDKLAHFIFSEEAQPAVPDGGLPRHWRLLSLPGHSPSLSQEIRERKKKRKREENAFFLRAPFSQLVSKVVSYLFMNYATRATTKIRCYPGLEAGRINGSIDPRSPDFVSENYCMIQCRLIYDLLKVWGEKRDIRYFDITFLSVSFKPVFCSRIEMPCNYEARGKYHLSRDAISSWLIVIALSYYRGMANELVLHRFYARFCRVPLQSIGYSDIQKAEGRRELGKSTFSKLLYESRKTVRLYFTGMPNNERAAVL